MLATHLDTTATTAPDQLSRATRHLHALAIPETYASCYSNSGGALVTARKQQKAPQTVKHQTAANATATLLMRSVLLYSSG